MGLLTMPRAGMGRRQGGGTVTTPRYCLSHYAAHVAAEAAGWKMLADSAERSGWEEVYLPQIGDMPTPQHFLGKDPQSMPLPDLRVYTIRPAAVRSVADALTAVAAILLDAMKALPAEKEHRI